VPTQYCFVVAVVVVAVVFCLVGAEHKFDVMFVVDKTLTNGEQRKVIKTDLFDDTCMFSPQDYLEISDASHDIITGIGGLSPLLSVQSVHFVEG
jgi:hypothetical protein